MKYKVIFRYCKNFINYKIILNNNKFSFQVFFIEILYFLNEDY